MCKDDLWFARQPIRELLRPISKRKMFFIDVEEYAGDMFLDVEKQMSVKVALQPAGNSIYNQQYTTARIKWKSKEPVR
eukprot:14987954-Heterocapsa_arctica.AAC.1